MFLGKGRSPRHVEPLAGARALVAPMPAGVLVLVVLDIIVAFADVLFILFAEYAFFGIVPGTVANFREGLCVSLAYDRRVLKGYCFFVS